MRELIYSVRAEAQKVLDSEADSDRYHLEMLQANERKRDAARARIKACNDALEAITAAAKHLAGPK